MSVGTDSPASNSQNLSSSHSSLNTVHSKKAAHELSKTYKHASQLYLTRQLYEAYEVLQHVIAPKLPRHNFHESIHSVNEDTQPAPIASAGTSQRIKIWSLYVTLLNAIVDLGPEEGKRDFGSKEYSSLVRLVQSGDIWEDVVRAGYGGREGNVDAEVVYNLSNLLLAQAPNQQANQMRLETYLSSSPGELNLSEHLEQRLNAHVNGNKTHMNGANTPKDLTSRIKILELFTLHVLPRNEEWDYAKSFINNSDILDDERREAFLQTLQELEDSREQEQATFTETEDEYIDEPELESSGGPQPGKINGLAQSSPRKGDSLHNRTSSEVDYGIDHAHPNGSKSLTSPSLPNSQSDEQGPMKTLTPTPVPDSSQAVQAPPSSSSQGPQAKVPSRSSAVRRSQNPRPSKPKPKASPATQQNNIIRQARQIYTLITTLSSNITHSLTKSPAALLRTLMFLVAFLMLLSRKDVRQRIQRILDRGWTKIRSTVGMGVKVSYI